MKTNLTTTLLMMAVSLPLAFSSIAQEVHQEPQKGKSDVQAQYYRRTLRIDSVKAYRIAVIQSEYKAGMKAALSDSSLTAESRRLRIEELMERKNSRLRAFLSAEEQEQVIPSTERGTAGRVVNK